MLGLCRASWCLGEPQLLPALGPCPGAAAASPTQLRGAAVADVLGKVSFALDMVGVGIVAVLNPWPSLAAFMAGLAPSMMLERQMMELSRPELQRSITESIGLEGTFQGHLAQPLITAGGRQEFVWSCPGLSRSHTLLLGCRSCRLWCPQSQLCLSPLSGGCRGAGWAQPAELRMGWWPPASLALWLHKV